MQWIVKASIKKTRINKLGKYPCKKKKKDHIINFEILPTNHLTKQFILNPVEGSRSACARIPNQHQSFMG